MNGAAACFGAPIDVRGAEFQFQFNPIYPKSLKAWMKRRSKRSLRSRKWVKLPPLVSVPVMGLTHYGL